MLLQVGEMSDKLTSSFNQLPRACYDCGLVQEERALLCPRCGSGDLVSGETRPRGARMNVYAVPFPVDCLESWPPGGVVALSGGPGAGKSSVAALLSGHFAKECECAWLTSEQTPDMAAMLIKRMVKEQDQMPYVERVNSLDTVREALSRRKGKAFAVLDSITRCGSWTQQADVLEEMVSWTQAVPGRRSLIVLQINSRGEAAGLLSMPHRVDATLEVNVTGGLRCLSTTKNRHGEMGTRYFKLGKVLERPDFPLSYSVEDAGGTFRLQPYPLSIPRPQWSGLLDHMKELRIYQRKEPYMQGVASAGIFCLGYPDNACVPDDVEARQRFAEAHGLKWLMPEEWNQTIDRAQ